MINRNMNMRTRLFAARILFFLTFFLLFAIGQSSMPAGDSSTDHQFRVPFIENIEIDGNADDWEGGGLSVEYLHVLEDIPRPDPDVFNAEFRLGWDNTGLLIMVEVTGETGNEHPDDNRLGDGDCVEFFLFKPLAKAGHYDHCHVIISPGMTEEHPEPRYTLHGNSGEKAPDTVVEFAREETEDGYVIEARFPWAKLETEPATGDVFGFQIYVRSGDESGSVQTTKIWFPRANTNRHLSANHLIESAKHLIKLADSPSPPVQGAARLAGPSTVVIEGAPELAGAAIKMTVGDRVLAKSQMPKLKEDSVTTQLSLQIPPFAPGENFQNFVITAIPADGEPATLAIDNFNLPQNVNLPVLDEIRPLGDGKFEITVHEPDGVLAFSLSHLHIAVKGTEFDPVAETEAEVGELCRITVPTEGHYTLSLFLLDEQSRLIGRKVYPVEDGELLTDEPEEPLAIVIADLCDLTPFEQNAAWSLALQARIVAELVENYHCVVLSRQEGMLMATEQAVQEMAAVQNEGATMASEIPAADFVVVPAISLKEVKALNTNSITHNGTLHLYDFTEPEVDNFQKIDFHGALISDFHDELFRQIILNLRLRPRRHIQPEPAVPVEPLDDTWAVLPMIMLDDYEKLGDDSRTDGGASMEIEKALQKSGRLRNIVDRSRIEDILAELNIAAIGEMSEGAAAGVARIAGADRILVPTLSVPVYGQWNYLRVDVLLVDSETAAILAGKSAFCQIDNAGATAAELAVELAEQPVSVPEFNVSQQQRRLLEADLYLENMRYLLHHRGTNSKAELRYIFARRFFESAFFVGKDDPDTAYKLLHMFNYFYVRPYKNNPKVREFGTRMVEFLLDLPAMPQKWSYDHRIGIRAFYIYLRSGEFKKALELISNRPELFSTDRQRHYFRLKTYVRMEMYEEARDELQYLDGWPKSYQRYNRIITYHLGTEEEYFEALIEEHRRYNAADSLNRCHLELMRLIEKLESPGAVVDFVRQEFSLMIQGMPEIQLELARHHHAMGDLDKAFAILERLASPVMPGAKFNPSENEEEPEERHVRVMAELSAKVPESKFQWRTLTDVNPVPEQYTLYIQPLGPVDEEVVKEAAIMLGDFLGEAGVEILPVLPLPKDDAAYQRNRQSYGGINLLDRLSQPVTSSLPGDAVYVVFVTRETVLYKTKRRIDSLSHAGNMVVSYGRWLSYRSGRTGLSEALAKQLANCFLVFAAAPQEAMATSCFTAYCPNAPCIGSALTYVSKPYRMELALCEDCQENLKEIDYRQVQRRFQQWRPPRYDAETSRLNAEYLKIIEPILQTYSGKSEWLEK